MLEESEKKFLNKNYIMIIFFNSGYLQIWGTIRINMSVPLKYIAYYWGAYPVLRYSTGVHTPYAPRYYIYYLPRMNSGTIITNYPVCTPIL